MPTEMADYLRDPKAIYRESFAIVRRETDLRHLPPEIGRVAVRLVHACGMPDIAADLAWRSDVVGAGRAALQAGWPVVADVRMVEAGIIRSRLPAGNEVHVSVAETDVADAAAARGTTRSAVAIERLAPRWAGGVLAIGSAPTALFRVLEMIADGATPPAVILAFPVGFVGAAESKEALVAADLSVPYLTLRGRRGGSAMAAAAVNAIAGGDDD